MSPQPPPAPPSAPPPGPPLGLPLGLLRGTAFGGSLAPLAVGRAQAPTGRNRMLLALETGRADVALAGRRLGLAGPALLWAPWPAEAKMTLSAGAVGHYLIVGQTTLLNAIGHAPEAADLRALTDRQITLPLADRPDLAGGIHAGLAAILDEHSAAAVAARSVVEAHLRVLLVRLWRACAISATAGKSYPPSRLLLNNFNMLVEAHFRDHWTIQDYAAALGLSRDRLGDICRRVAGRTPKQVTTARTMAEARMLLSHSSHSVEQIAGLLGYGSASQFSRAFARATGHPPSRFRAGDVDG